MISILKKTYFLSFLSYKLKGGALMFSLFIMIILSVFLGMLSITSHFDHLVFNRTLILDHAWADVYSTFDYLLEHETGFDEKKNR